MRVVLPALALLASVQAAAAASPAHEPDAIAPILFALRKEHPEFLHPRVPNVWIGRATETGERTVCGLVSFDGSRFSELRFIGLVDEAALRYRGAPALLVEERRSATFTLAWSRQCEH